MSRSIVKFAAIVLVIAALLYTGIFGLDFSDKFSIPGVADEGGITQGLDLKGGTVIVYKAQAENPSEEDMDTVASMLRTRLDGQGYTEATLTRQGTDKIRVELPDVQDAQTAVETLGATAQLIFAETVSQDPNDPMKVVVDTPVMDGNAVKSAVAEYGQTSDDLAASNSYYIALELTDEGRQKFSEATGRLVGKPIYIVMDGIIISAPNVQQKIDSNSCVITGEFTPEEAKSLAANIKSGQLPFSLEQVEVRTVSATLGDEALHNAILAGIILSVGMAVDANVVIFERVKEELRLGKTVRSAVDAGFNRALTAVIDSNITTIIAAVILWWLGTGTIKGFGITLFIGIVVSMLSAIFVTKFLLKQMIGMNIKNTWFYGVSKKKDIEAEKGGKA